MYTCCHRSICGNKYTYTLYLWLIGLKNLTYIIQFNMKKLVLLGLLVLLLNNFSQAQSAKNIHDKAIVVDTHCDILSNQIKSGIDIGKRQKTGNFDLERAKIGGLDVQVFSVWSDARGNYSSAKHEIDSLFSLIKRYPNKIALVKTDIELQKVVSQHKMAAMIGVEGGHMIENSLDYIDSLAKCGMCYLTLTWNNSTSWASSSADEVSGKVKPENAGLTDFGKQVVQRLNKLGVMVDLSHVGEKTFYDAIAVSTKPVIASHSAVYNLNPVPRNLKDDQIKAIAKSKGVIFVNFYSGFIDSTFNVKQKAFLSKYSNELEQLKAKIGNRSDAIDTLIAKHKEETEIMRPSLSVLIKHIDYIVKLVGVDYVGLGADFDGAESFPKGFNGVADYPKITSALLKKGYPVKDINKILGGNFIRVLKENKEN